MPIKKKTVEEQVHDKIMSNGRRAAARNDNGGSLFDPNVVNPNAAKILRDVTTFNVKKPLYHGHHVLKGK